jgi:hypothetical protein
MIFYDESVHFVVCVLGEGVLHCLNFDLGLCSSCERNSFIELGCLNEEW